MRLRLDLFGFSGCRCGTVVLWLSLSLSFILRLLICFCGEFGRRLGLCRLPRSYRLGRQWYCDMCSDPHEDLYSDSPKCDCPAAAKQFKRNFPEVEAGMVVY